MKTLIVNGHLDPKSSHAQQFFYESIKHEDNVTVLFLSDMIPFDPKMLLQYDRILLQFPIYWYGAPWLMKQWIDTTFQSEMPFLKGKEFGIIAFFGTTKNKYGAGNVEQFTIVDMLRPYQMIANYFKMTYLPVFSVFQFSYIPDDEKQRYLVRYQRHVTGKAHMTFENVGEWYIERLEKIKNTEEIRAYIVEKLEEYDQLKYIIKDMDNDVV